MNTTARSLIGSLFLLFITTTAAAEWESITPGVKYQRFREENVDIHVARVDLTRDDLKIVATREADRGLRVSDFAKRNHAVIAINAGYFDQNMKPIGLTVSPCGQWVGSKDGTWGAVVAFGAERAELFEEKKTMEVAEPWITSAVSGWPTLVKNCRARTAKELPGSDSFTRSPHARTAVGFSADGKRAYFIVADGKREGVPGLTLAELAAWMQDRLGVCLALNLDGGGSSAFWVEDRIVNKPSDGKERRVADHLAVVRTEDFVACESDDDARRSATAAGASQSQSPRPRKRQ